MWNSQDELNEHLKVVMDDVNSRPISEFEGISPKQMHHLLHFTFTPGSLLQFRNDIPESTLNTIPFFNLTEAFLRILKEKGTVKLTSTGSLPLEIVRELYNLRYLPDWYIDKYSSGRILEKEWAALIAIKAVCKMAGLVTNRKNKLTLSKKALGLMNPEKRPELLKEIFSAFCMKYNWGYTDGYGDVPVGQFGFGFVLILLLKYGHAEQEDNFYGEKYLKAFPTFFEQVNGPSYKPQNEYLIDCFSWRFFEHFCAWFGLVSHRKESIGKDEKLLVTKTKALNDIFLHV